MSGDGKGWKIGRDAKKWKKREIEQGDLQVAKIENEISRHEWDRRADLTVTVSNGAQI